MAQKKDGQGEDETERDGRERGRPENGETGIEMEPKRIE
jgi:hypothetical protein